MPFIGPKPADTVLDTTLIGDGTVTKAKLAADAKTNITDDGTEGTKVAVGTTAQRGSTIGQWRFNSTTGFFEGRNNSGTFQTLEPTPSVISADTTEVDSNAGGNITIRITGTNFTSGATIKFIGNDATELTASTSTFINTSTYDAVIARNSFVNSKEPYDIKYVSSTGTTATLDNYINVDTSPTWNTSSGSLGTIDHTQLAGGYSLTALSATDADGDTIVYSQPSGSLPTNLTLNTSNGSWSGTVPGLVSTTTYNFTGRATANSKTADRSFSITQEGELNHYGTQFAYSFNGDIDNAGSNTAVTATSHGSFNDDSTTQTKFNAKSAHFTNTGFSRFTIPNHADLQFGTGHFTIEGWIYLVNDSSNVGLSARVFQMGDNNSNGIALIHNYASEFTFSNTHSNFLTDNPSNWLGAWRYFTVDYDGSTYRLYRDGAVIDTQTSGFNSVNISDDLHFGVYPGSLTGIRSNMFLSEWQITKGTAKYAGAFTPKSSAFLT